MNAQESFVQRVRQELARQRLSVRAAASRSAVPVRSMHGILNEGHVPSINRAAEIASAIGLEFYIGPPRQPPPADLYDDAIVTETRAAEALPAPYAAAALPQQIDDLAYYVRALNCLAFQLGADPLPPYTRDKLTGDYGYVPFFAEDTDEARHEPSHVALRSGWLRQLGLRPHEVRLVELVDDGMAPALRAGDLALVRTVQPRPRTGRLMALKGDGGTVVRRLRRSRNRWWAHADHVDFEPHALPHNAGLIGQVVWWAHTEAQGGNEK